MEVLYNDFLEYREKKGMYSIINGLELTIALKRGEISKLKYHCDLGEIQLSSLFIEKLLEPENVKKELEESTIVAKGKILDFGGGIGELSLYLAQKGHQITYYEVNESCKIFAKYLFAKYKVEDQVDNKIEYKYDTIFALNVLDHLDNPIETLKYLYELLNPNGRLIISVSYDGDLNPVHINDITKINELENLIGCCFKEILLEGQNDHHRILEKREFILETPMNSDGYYLIPPDYKYDFTQLEVKISPDVEIIQVREQMYIGFAQTYRSRLHMDNNLRELLMRIYSPKNLEELYMWAVDFYKVDNFRDSFYKVILYLWENKIILGRFMKGGDQSG